MDEVKYHTIFFETLGRRSRIRIEEDSIDSFLDLMNTRSVEIISEDTYYDLMPCNSEDVAVKKLKGLGGHTFGECEEYVIK